MNSLELMALVLFGLPAGMLFLVLLLRRGLSWMEDHGFIIISEVTDSNRTLGGSLLELQKLAEPSAKHVIEARDADDLHQEEDGSGDGTEHAQQKRRRQFQEAMKRQREKEESRRKYSG